ncbi:hypothetical protein [Mesonia aestuariivivens]|uniref:WD40 repeat domain-containing protein n=1 Tax=Mesonia aestuariivivens TaxID=2796128 RepID=A0ABS6W2P9_9FLAO|nr:hypothetical protein [Mesonia aestuariivivens]MBW2962125.1 hypothetical protein [Mesonia aestuariivivens]
MKIYTFIIFILITLQVKSQEITTSLVEKTPFNLEQFVGVDKFNNFYGIKNNTLYKLEGAKHYQFADLQLGELTSVDLLNPLKITLFYKNTNTVVFVDNRLNEINRINFTTISNFRNIAFATTGKDKSLWIYNIDEQQLELFNYHTSKAILHTQPISNELLSQKSNYNFCWLLQQEKLEYYNSYGSFMGSYKVPKNFKFSEHNHLIVGKTDEKWLILRKNHSSFETLSVSQNAVKDFYLNNENLYIYVDNLIYQYQLNLSNE